MLSAFRVTRHNGRIGPSVVFGPSGSRRGYQRMSNLFLPIVKGLSTSLETPVHELFIKSGLIRQPVAGLAVYLPVGLRILRKLESLFRRHFSAAGSEVSLPTLSCAELWQKTNRWDNPELLKLQTTRKQDFCLTATAEEDIAALVKDSVNSYRGMPLTLWQMTRKFRDEKRPRAGLLRGREFVMLDAYSFDVDEAAARETYAEMHKVYTAAFAELGLLVTVAEADSGTIGGNMSHEFHLLHPSGQDTLMVCGECGYAANSERAVAFPAKNAEKAEKAEKAETDTSVAVEYAVSEDRDTLVALYYPKHRTLNRAAVREAVPDLDSELEDSEAVLAAFASADSSELYLKQVVRVMDPHVAPGAELPEFPLRHFHRNNMATLSDVPIVFAEPGEICPSCRSGELRAEHGIEVGHTFYLGDKYSAPLGLRYADRDGKLKTVQMGCYGIGVTRVLAATAAVLRDGRGFRWPTAIAPFHVAVICDNSELAENVAEKVAETLEAQGIDVVIDDRAKTRGWKLRDSEVLGIPYRVIVKSDGAVKVEARDGEEVTLGDLPGFLGVTGAGKCEI